MNDARIPLFGAEEAQAAAAEAGVPAQLADLSIFRVLLRRPRLARATSDLLLSLLFGGELDQRLRELVILRIGWATGSVYEWTQHWRVASDLGLSEADMLGVREWRSHAGFGPAERAVLAATDEALGGGAVSEATWKELRAHVDSDDALVELVAAIGAWSMVSTFLRSLDVPLEDGVEPWPPDGMVPDGRGPEGAR